MLRWGKPGKPLLVFLHGKEAHADWWRFIAPFFAEHYRVVAPSWSGMGGSDRRDAYSMTLFAAELIDLIASEQAADGATVVGHSFGGFVALCAAALRPDLIAKVITVDTPLDPVPGWPGPPARGIADALYASAEEGVARFRFTPADQPVEAHIRDFIAYTSLRDDGDGWRWRFDPSMWHRFTIDLAPSFVAVGQPVAMIWGEASSLMPASLRQRMADATPHLASIGIPAAGHHVIVDQPLAFVAALRALLARKPAVALHSNG